jgi:hypothetical protein
MLVAAMLTTCLEELIVTRNLNHVGGCSLPRHCQSRDNRKQAQRTPQHGRINLTAVPSPPVHHPHAGIFPPPKLPPKAAPMGRPPKRTDRATLRYLCYQQARAAGSREVHSSQGRRTGHSMVRPLLAREGGGEDSERGVRSPPTCRGLPSPAFQNRNPLKPQAPSPKRNAPTLPPVQRPVSPHVAGRTPACLLA